MLRNIVQQSAESVESVLKTSPDSWMSIGPHCYHSVQYTYSNVGLVQRTLPDATLSQFANWLTDFRLLKSVKKDAVQFTVGLI